MNHPVTMQQMIKIHQAELLREAEVHRALQSAQVGGPGLSRRWLVVVLAISALVGGLAVIWSMI